MSASVWQPGSTVSVNSANDVAAQSFQAILNQTVFTLTNFNYVPGTGSLLVFVNGAVQRPGIDFFETSSTTFTLTDASYATDVVLAIGFNYIEAVASSSDAANTNYTPPFSGAVSTTVKNKLAQTVSIKDFGAIGDGTTDDSSAFTALVTYCAATGATGWIPAGTYSISPSSITFSSNTPFRIVGDGVDSTTLKNRNTASSFIYWTNPNGVSIENLSIDGAYTGSPSTPVSGGTVVFVNSSNNKFANLKISNIYRVALMIYNDHQTTLTNVYKNIVVDNVKVYGPTNAINNVGPSAFILADVNNSIIKNCYINNIGLYGYEFKNDSTNNIIADCVAEDTYYPIYFGGDGVHTELSYVKYSLVENCIVRRALSGSAITTGLALYNTMRNILIDQTGVVATNYAVYVSSSTGCSFTGIDLIGRNHEAVTIRTNSTGNTVEFTNLIDGAYSGRGTSGIAADNSNNTVVFRNRDSTQQMFLESYSFNNNTVIDEKFHYSWQNPATSALVKLRFGDVGNDDIPSTAEGLAVVGNTSDYYQISNQASIYQYFGSFAKSDIVGVRYRLTDGTKLESLYNGASTATYITDSGGFRPNEDNSRKLGDVSNRWTTVYATTGTINTSDIREKQQLRDTTNAEVAVAKRIKKLIKAYKFTDSVDVKGEKARIHFGVAAQDIKDAFTAEGLDASRYGLFCYDEWPEQLEVRDEQGKVITPYVAAGNKYGVRYEELLTFIISTL